MCKRQGLPQARLLVCPPLSVPDTHALSGAAGRSELVKSQPFSLGHPSLGGSEAPACAPAGGVEETLKSHVRCEQLWPILGPHAEDMVLLPPSYFQPSLQVQPVPSGTSPSDAADAK